MDLLTGNGDESGYSISELIWGELSWTFEGRFCMTYTGGVGNRPRRLTRYRRLRWNEAHGRLYYRARTTVHCEF